LALTRYHYFASVPDATLVVFLLAGFYLPFVVARSVHGEYAVVVYAAIVRRCQRCVTPRIRSVGLCDTVAGGRLSGCIGGSGARCCPMGVVL
jgi:hypothetical protein